MELVIASQNPHKVLEIKEILKALGFELQLLSLYDFDYVPEQERGTSFVANAEAKALRAAAALNKFCIADDFGLVVPILGGLATTFKNRYETPTSTVQQVKELLQAMKPYKERELRAAYLECSLAVATPSGEVRSVQACSEGSIAEEERGKITCDFDTVFIKHDYSKTLAELSAAVRSRISHRRKACEKLMGPMSALFKV